MRVRNFALALLIVTAVACAQTQPPPSELWKQTEQAMGRTGAAQADGSFKFAMPRTDLKVTVSGVQLKPPLALGSWAAFKQTGESAVVMGDLVLNESEVTQVMDALEKGAGSKSARCTIIFWANRRA